MSLRVGRFGVDDHRARQIEEIKAVSLTTPAWRHHDRVRGILWYKVRLYASKFLAMSTSQINIKIYERNNDISKKMDEMPPQPREVAWSWTENDPSLTKLFIGGRRDCDGGFALNSLCGEFPRLGEYASGLFHTYHDGLEKLPYLSSWNFNNEPYW